MRTFEKLLSKVRLTRAEAGNRAFDSAFCRPVSGALRDRWDELRAEREQRTGPREAVAQTLLLSYRAGIGGSLWLLEASAPGQGDAMLGARAQRMLDRAMLLVSRELPALVAPPQRAVSWSVSRIHTEGEIALDGESFGLSICLAAAAHRLGLPSPSTVAATAAVDGDGVLFDVGGLEEKLGVLHQWALGVETVIVAANQLDAAQALAQRLEAPWQIVGARNLAEATTAAFPNLWTDVMAHWSAPAKLAQVAADLHRLARDGSNQVLSWKGIADAAGRVAARLPETGSGAQDARFAQLVAQRHEGHDALIELDQAYLASMRRPLRLRCLAHIVQSHADCSEVLDPAIEHAVAQMLPPDSRDDAGDDLRLLGAIGRLLAAFFRYSEAEVALQRAVRGWYELDCIPEASFALSELLRVVALTGALPSFTLAVHEYAHAFLKDPRTDAVSRCFILYSLGRGQSLLGNHGEAHRFLADGACEWALSPDHLRALRLRWLTKVVRAEGAADRVEGYVRQLSEIVERAPELEVVAVLAKLDRDQHERNDATSALGAFQSCRPREYRRFATAYDDDLAGRVVREYRY